MMRFTALQLSNDFRIASFINQFRGISISLRSRIQVARRVTGNTVFNVSAEHLPQLAQIINRLFEFGRLNSRLAARSVALAEQHQVVEVF